MGVMSVGALFDLLFQFPREAAERFGSELALVPLEPWTVPTPALSIHATVTGRSQLVRTTLGRQAPAMEAWCYPIYALTSLPIGRSRQATIRIEQPTISRLHAELLTKSGRVSVRDSGSYNGTLVNGRLLDPDEVVKLSDGDVLGLGEAQLLFASLTHLASLFPVAR